MSRILFTGIFLLLAAQVFSQYDNFALRNYTAIHGLPQSQVNSIIEDANGYIWVATSGGGLARFDGQEFKVYTTLDGLLSNSVLDLKIDSQQNLWMVHPRGVSKFDGQSFKKFQAPGELSNLKMVRRTYMFNDTVFVLSAPGVLGKIYKDSVYYWNKEYGTDKRIIRIHPLSNGDLCLFISDRSVVQRTLNGDIIVGTIPEGKGIHSIYDYGGNMMVSFDSSTGEHKTFSLNPATRKLEPHLTQFDKYVLLYDNHTKTYWLHDGNTLFSLQEGKTSPKEVLRETDVRQVLADKEGNIWLATNGMGLYKYSHQDFSKCSSENMRGVMGIHESSDQSTWIGTMDKGLWKISKGKIKYYQNKLEPYKNSIVCIAEAPDGTVWIGTQSGLGMYDAVKDDFIWYTTQQGLSGNVVIAIAFDERGNLWAGTGNGLNYFDGKEFRHFTIEQGLLTNMVNALYYNQKHKTLFVGNEFGVNTIVNGKVKRLPISGFENTTILSIHSYKDSLILLGSGGAGFAVLDPKTNASHFITTRQGLLSDFIYFIAADEKNRIWVGTERGIDRIVLNDKFEVIENLRFDHDNGLEGVETNQNAFYLGKDDKFFGLIDGLYQFNELKQSNTHSFDPHLTSVDIFYGEESARSYADSVFGLYKLPYSPIFPSDKNHLTFSFNRVDKCYPKSVQFKYRLKNFDQDWSQPSSNRQVTYSNLPPGNYEFQLMATNNQGSWSPVQLRYPFVVKAPFYKTATFGLLVFVVLICLVLFIFFWRVHLRVEKRLMLERIREQEQENLRKEIARDFHDEMGNQLTRIINYVSLLKLNGSIHYNGNGATSQVDLYTKVENSAKYLYTGTRDFIWSIDPVNDELSKLFLHIRDFGEKLFEEKDIKFRAHNSVKGKIKLPYGFSREANLIFKEVMTNTFKSSQAQNATFSLQQTEDGYEFTFHDDGIGFNISGIENSNGLKNIRERADKLMAVLRIRSKPEEGATISLSFKLTKIKQHGTTI